MSKMMRRNCSRGCCLSGSRIDDKREWQNQAVEELCTYIVPRPGESLLEIINDGFDSAD